jgi:hypothetical protein
VHIQQPDRVNALIRDFLLDLEPQPA